jgi:hypothetical protein
MFCICFCEFASALLLCIILYFLLLYFLVFCSVLNFCSSLPIVVFSAFFKSVLSTVLFLIPLLYILCFTLFFFGFAPDLRPLVVSYLSMLHNISGCRVSDLHHFNAVPDLDPAFLFNSDPGPAFYFNADPDPDPHQGDANLRPGLQTLQTSILSLCTSI